MPIAQDTSAPPPAPEVSQQQQGPALSQFAAQAQAQSTNPSIEFIKQSLKQIAAVLGKVGMAVSMEHRELMPFVKRMVGAGKLLEQEIAKAETQAQPGAGSGSEPPPSQGGEGAETLGL